MFNEDQEKSDAVHSNALCSWNIYKKKSLIEMLQFAFVGLGIFIIKLKVIVQLKMSSLTHSHVVQMTQKKVFW